MTRTKRTQTEKAHAVGVALAVGVTEAERQTGIPKQSIDYWLNSPAFGHLRTRARADVATEMWAGLQVGLQAVVDGLRSPEAPLRDKAQAFGILYDRFALINGEATSRTESKTLTDGLDDTEKQRLRDWIDSLATAAPAEGAAV